MNSTPKRRGGWADDPPLVRYAFAIVPVTMIVLLAPGLAQAGKLSWLDEVVQDVILEAKAGSKRVVRSGEGARAELRRRPVVRCLRSRRRP